MQAKHKHKHKYIQLLTALEDEPGLLVNIQLTKNMYISACQRIRWIRIKYSIAGMIGLGG